MNDEKFKYLLEESENNFENIRDDCINEFLFLLPIIENKNNTPQIENKKEYGDLQIIEKILNEPSKKYEEYLTTDRWDLPNTFTLHKNTYNRPCRTLNNLSCIIPVVNVNNKYVFVFESKFLNNFIIKIKLLNTIDVMYKKIYWKNNANLIDKIDIYYGDNFLISIDGLSIIIYHLLHKINIENNDIYEYNIPFELFLNSVPTKINIYKNKLSFHIYFNNPYDYLMIDTFEEIFKASNLIEQCLFEPEIIYNELLLNPNEKQRYEQVAHEFLTNDYLLFQKNNYDSNENIVDLQILDNKNITFEYCICLTHNDEFLNPQKYIKKIELLVDNNVYFSIQTKIINCLNKMNKLDIPYDKILFYNYNTNSVSNLQPMIQLNFRHFENIVLRVHLLENIKCNVILCLGVKNIYAFMGDEIIIRK